MNKIRVMVVDDSALMRKIISDMINEESDMEVIAVARNGEELLQKVQELNPDVITLDVEMPKIDGITALKYLKDKKIYSKVIMLSSLTSKSSQVTLECLEAGAADFIQKPSGSISLDINKVKEDLMLKIRATSSIKKSLFDFNYKKSSVIPEKKTIESPMNIEAIVIGASTGGPRALQALLTQVPGNIDVPILVVQHMPAGFTKTFAERLDTLCKLKVLEARDKMKIEKNTIYIAPGGYHMEVANNKTIALNLDPTMWGVRPAVDKLFTTAADVYKNRLISVVLTGMGKDGARGTVVVKENGGYTISEDESSCTIYGMPRAAFETGKVDEVLPLLDISSRIVFKISNH